MSGSAQEEDAPWYDRSWTRRISIWLKWAANVPNCISPNSTWKPHQSAHGNFISIAPLNIEVLSNRLTSSALHRVLA
jgi:hypothetical protein